MKIHHIFASTQGAEGHDPRSLIHFYIIGWYIIGRVHSYISICGRFDSQDGANDHPISLSGILDSVKKILSLC